MLSLMAARLVLLDFDPLRREVLLKTWSDRNTENERRAKDLLFSYQNSRKARKGMLAGLLDPGIMAEKRKQEQALRDAVQKNPEWKKQYGDAWSQVDTAVVGLQKIYKDYYLWEAPAAPTTKAAQTICQVVCKFVAG